MREKLHVWSSFNEAQFDEDTNFPSEIRKSYKNSGDLKLLTMFRRKNSKFQWFCAACSSTMKSKTLFNTMFSLRIFCLEHLNDQHQKENPDIKTLVEKELELLNEETQFDIEEIMELTKSRRDVKHHSRLKFYTINLKNYENGENLEEYLKNHSQKQEKEHDFRLCLICLNLINKSNIDQHFRAGKSHVDLESHSHISTFFELPSVKIENIPNEDDSDLTFPKDIFAYCTVFKTNRLDMFKWRCCLCPHAHAHTFVTFVVLRMFALRHIEENHKYLFLDAFLESEWNILKSELQIGFDVRHFQPTMYTSRGENTFNPKNPNDYTLPQQFFFIPPDFLGQYLICGFCYKSFNKREFIKHIVLHGFIEKQVQGILTSARINDKIEDLMEFSNAKCIQPSDESVPMLSIEGKRLKIKLDQIAERWSSSVSNCSTPASSRQTPSKRKSAIEAKQLLSETFKILQENFKDKRRTWDDPMDIHSASSSSDDTSSDEYKEPDSKKKRNKRNMIDAVKIESLDDIDGNSERILNWIQLEAEKRGFNFNFEDSSDEDETFVVPKIEIEEGMNEGKPRIEQEKEGKPRIEQEKEGKSRTEVETSKTKKKRVRIQSTSDRNSSKQLKKKRVRAASYQTPLKINLNLDSMTPEELRQVIRDAAKERGFVYASTSSDSDSESGEKQATLSEEKSTIFDKMTPVQMRKYLKVKAVEKGIKNGFEDSSSSDSSSDEDEKRKEKSKKRQKTVSKTSNNSEPKPIVRRQR